MASGLGEGLVVIREQSPINVGAVRFGYLHVHPELPTRNATFYRASIEEAQDRYTSQNLKKSLEPRGIAVVYIYWTNKVLGRSHPRTRLYTPYHQ